MDLNEGAIVFLIGLGISGGLSLLVTLAIFFSIRNRA